MSDKKLYPIFIAMVAVSTSIAIFNAYQDHQDRKLKREEMKRKGITKENIGDEKA